MEETNTTPTPEQPTDLVVAEPLPLPPHWIGSLVRTHEQHTLVKAVDQRGRMVYDMVHFRMAGKFGPIHIVGVVLSEQRDGMVGPSLMCWVGGTMYGRTGPALGLSGYSKAWGRNTAVDRALHRVHDRWHRPDLFFPSTLHGKELRQLVVSRVKEIAGAGGK